MPAEGGAENNPVFGGVGLGGDVIEVQAGAEAAGVF